MSVIPTSWCRARSLGTPCGHAGPALEQGNEALASVERAVESGQVRDLKRDNDDPDGANGDIHGRVGSAAAVDCSNREERGQGLEQPIGEPYAGPDEDEREPEYKAGRPEQHLHDQGDRAGRRQNGVLTLVRLRQVGRQDEAQPDAPVDVETQPLDARRSPREDHGQYDIGHGDHHHDQAGDRCDDVHRPATQSFERGTSTSVSSAYGYYLKAGGSSPPPAPKEYTRQAASSGYWVGDGLASSA